MPDSPTLAGRVAIVTGASSGLGHATAARLARAGAAVSLLARDADDLAAAEAEITTGGGTALAVPTDLAEPAAADAAVQRTAAAWGRVDILVNAAGTDAPGAIEQISVADWDRVMAVNLRAPFLLVPEQVRRVELNGFGLAPCGEDHGFVLEHFLIDIQRCAQG